MHLEHSVETHEIIIGLVRPYSWTKTICLKNTELTRFLNITQKKFVWQSFLHKRFLQHYRTHHLTIRSNRKVNVDVTLVFTTKNVWYIQFVAATESFVYNLWSNYGCKINESIRKPHIRPNYTAEHLFLSEAYKTAINCIWGCWM